MNITDEHIKKGVTKIKSIARLQEITKGKLKNLVKNNKVFSPINKFYKGITYKFFRSKIKKIIKKDISINSLKEFDEIILIGSGKGVASVKTINQIKWKRKNLKFYNILSRHYKSAISNCKRYS